METHILDRFASHILHKVEVGFSEQEHIFDDRLALAEVGDGLCDPFLGAAHVDSHVVELLEHGLLAFLAEPFAGLDAVGKHADDRLAVVYACLAHFGCHEFLGYIVRHLVLHIFVEVEIVDTGNIESDVRFSILCYNCVITPL